MLGEVTLDLQYQISLLSLEIGLILCGSVYGAIGIAHSVCVKANNALAAKEDQELALEGRGGKEANTHLPLRRIWT